MPQGSRIYRQMSEQKWDLLDALPSLGGDLFKAWFHNHHLCSECTELSQRWSVHSFACILTLPFVCVCVCVCEITAVVSNSVQLCGLQPARLLCPRNSPGKNTRVGCHAFLQGLFPTQGLNLGLLHLPHHRQILYHWANGEAPTLLSITRQLNTEAYIFNELHHSSPHSNHLPSPHKRSAKST